MGQNAWRNVRALIRYVVYAGCGLIVLFAIMICVSFLMNPFAGFAGQSEFSDLSGYSAKRRLSDWPSDVDPRDVQNVSYKSEYSRDSYSSWYRISLSATAAEKWTNQIHKHQEDWSRGCLGDLHEGLEGVHRTISGPPPLHWQTGETPTWWTPPNIDFRATEVMLWYTNYDSGVGRATYTSFDNLAGVLWMYDYACQHDKLWTHGNVPTGNVFMSSKDNAEQSDADEALDQPL
ncbi:MAG: hypothetical protein WCI02_15030 [Planctomycetota bacterium]